ncbi:MAG: lipoate--protein ligase family protein [archaeon GB-1867-005]|nr:lipoate--protein ligase family protein [Candidatus Culexmicrobium cathedralense]
MKFKAAYKAAKLIKVSIEVEAGRIKNIKFTGDFFIYPEEALGKLEEELKGAELNEYKLLQIVESFFIRENVTTPLIEARDFVKAIMKAVGREI